MQHLTPMVRHLTVGHTLNIRRSGGALVAVDMHTALLAAGIPSRLAYVGGPGDIPRPPNSLELHAPLSNRFFFGFGIPQRLDEAIRDSDVVHVYGLYTFLNLTAGRICRKYGVPLVYHPHGALVPEYRRRGRVKKAAALAAFELKNFQHVRAWRALTAFEAAQIRALVPHADILIEPNGVALPSSVDRVEGRHARLAVTASPRKRVFLYLARLRSVKGLDLLTDAWKRRAGQLRGCELWIAGADVDGTARRVRRSINQHLADRAFLLGQVSEEEKKWLYRAADVFVLLSRGEGLSPAVLEAMAYAKPVLLSSTCFFPEAAAAGAGYETGCDPDEVGRILVMFSAMPRRQLALMGRRARALVADDYNIKKVALSFNSKIRELIHPGTHGSHSGLGTQMSSIIARASNSMHPPGALFATKGESAPDTDS